MKQYFATVAPGIEEIAAQELEKLGAEKVKSGRQGVHFEGDQKLLYKVNLWARTIYRILQPIAEVKCYDAQELYHNINQIDWSQYLEINNSLAVNCTGGNQNLNHTHFTALQIKNAIVDQQRTKYNQRSDVNTLKPDVLIDAHIYKNHCIVSLDSSGGSLHKRGYRPAVGLAPLKETLAAATIKLSKWQPNLVFFDPLCGSGTLPIEAALIGLNIAPGLFRERFGFETWQDFDAELWQELKQAAISQQKAELSAAIFGSDRRHDLIDQAWDNAELCGIGDRIQFCPQNIVDIKPPAETGVIICNPPYGKRLGDESELGAFYKLLGDIFKQKFKGWTAYILTGNKQLAKRVGLRASRRIPLYNGAIPCTLLEYDLY